MTAAPLGVGVIGCGRVARAFHLPALERADGVANMGIADVDGSHASVDELLADPAVEAVLVSTPPATHASLARAVLDSGRHVLLEKPLTLTPDDAGALLAHPARERVVTAVGFNLRFHRLVADLRAAVADGRVGEVRLVRAHVDSATVSDDWRSGRETGGGVVWEIGSHHADLWRHLLGEEVEELSVRGDDRVAVLHGRGAGGALLTTTLVGGAPPSYEIAVVGSAGTLRASLLRGEAVRWRPFGTGGARGRRLREAAGAVADLPRRAAVARRGGDFVQGYVDEWETFAASVAAGRVLSPLASFEDGMAAVRLIAGALR